MDIAAIAPVPPPQSLLDALRNLRRPLLIGHVTPDADCLGSALGLCMAMRDRGIAAYFALPGSSAAKRLGFMLDIVPRDVLTNGSPTGHDAIVALDTAAAKRLNAPVTIDLLPDTPVLNIDHHLSNTGFGRINWIDAHACSTSEMRITSSVVQLR